MLPSIAEIEALHRKYASNEQVYDLVYGHCRIVHKIAMWCVDRNELAVDRELLRAACLLHDIGTYVLFDDDCHVVNQRLYPMHAIIGAAILNEEGIDERVVAAIRTHVLMGLNQVELTAENSRWVLPVRDFTPQSQEAELLCYADRFHSKHPTFNDAEAFYERMLVTMPRQAELFKQARQRYGTPDIETLARQYGQPIR